MRPEREPIVIRKRARETPEQARLRQRAEFLEAQRLGVFPTIKPLEKRKDV